MARTEDPREQAPEARAPEDPEHEQHLEQQREAKQERLNSPEHEEPQPPERKLGDLVDVSDPRPRLTVLGRMDGQIAIRLGWRKGMVAISNSRFRFLQNDLGMDILDDPEVYLF